MEKLVREGIPTLGSGGSQWPSQGHSAPGLFALREERQQRASASSGQGRPRSCGHGYGVLHGEARGPAEVWANPWFSSSGRYCTEQEEVPVGRKETRPAFSFAPFTLQGSEASSRTGPSRRAGLRRTQVATLVDDGPSVSTTGAGDGN